ncbi:hypothetical protein BRAO375_1550030 [Bradyrhizobium sp. ORS 375]|nr:hypothetical protein BRAO375_1550030 [Bradyrhizobium sp. ORS 375]
MMEGGCVRPDNAERRRPRRDDTHNTFVPTRIAARLTQYSTLRLLTQTQLNSVVRVSNQAHNPTYGR